MQTGSGTPNRTETGVLALAATIALGTTAYAEAVYFENDGSFSFHSPAFLALDITQPADQQVGPISAADHAIQFGYFGDYKYTYASTLYDADRFPDRGRVEFWGGPGGLNGSAFNIPQGEPIGAGAPNNWSGFVDIATFYVPTYYNGYQSSIVSAFGVGERGYVGVRFNSGPGEAYHYGWIGLTRTYVDSYFRVGNIEVFAWGYETEAGVPVAAGIPAPTSLAALAMGAVAFGSRKRREG